MVLRPSSSIAAPLAFARVAVSTCVRLRALSVLVSVATLFTVIRTFAENAIIGAAGRIIPAIASVIPANWFLSFCAAASPVLAISLNAWSMLPALSAIMPIFSVNLSACSPVSETSKRRARALPKRLPYIVSLSSPVLWAYWLIVWSNSFKKLSKPPAARMPAASNWMPIASAALAASVDGLIRALRTADSCVDTSAVLPVTPVQVANTAISSSIDTPSCAADPATDGKASASCSKVVTPFLAVICILSWMLPASSQARP